MSVAGAGLIPFPEFVPVDFAQSRMNRALGSGCVRATSLRHRPAPYCRDDLVNGLGGIDMAAVLWLRHG